MDDNSKMPFGKYQGTKMANVPASYLLWIFENNKCTAEVALYINRNLDVLQEEVKRAEKQKNR